MNGTTRVLLPLLVLAMFLAAWEFAVASGWLKPYLFPPPSKLARTAYELAFDGFPESIRITIHVGVTLARILGGFALAIAVAIPLGIAIGSHDLLERMTRPIIAFCRSVATLSLLPVAVVWFGTGETSKVFLIFWGCFWVMLSNVVAAIRLVDPILLRAARSMDASARRIFLAVRLPAALPRIASGARMALGVGFMVIVGAEMIGTIRGLGALIMESRTFYRSDITIVGMFTIGFIGLALAALLAWCERRLMPWQARLAEQAR
jgi:ABC-type nitrate/sulfonate/bicarbonate transport system permease component